MARGVGSKYDLIARDELDTRLAEFGVRLGHAESYQERLAFNTGKEIGELRRALEAATEALEGRAVRETRRVNIELATVLGLVDTVSDRVWKLEHPWRTRWARVRAWMQRTIHRD